MSVIIEVPTAAKGKARARSTSRGRHYTPETTKIAEREIREAAKVAFCGRQTFKGPVEVWIGCQYEPPKSTGKALRADMIARNAAKLTKPDIDNVTKLVLDALNPHLKSGFRGAWSDDATVVAVHARKFYGDTDMLTIEIDNAEKC
jgi:Holliday junction resolvase RusA-like endonuclease